MTERLLKDNKHDVVAVDISTEKIEHVLNHPRLTYLSIDIRHEDGRMEEQVANADIVVDLIAVANPAVYVTNPLDVFELNFTENMKVSQTTKKKRRRKREKKKKKRR